MKRDVSEEDPFGAYPAADFESVRKLLGRIDERPNSPGLFVADLVALISSIDVVAPEIDR